MLNVQRQDLATVSLLKLDGNIFIGETDSLRDVVQTLPATSSVVLDLSHVNMVDAHGMGALLQMREQALARDMNFELMNISPQLRELFRITRLDTVFQIRSGFAFFPRLASARRVPVAA